MYCKIIEKMIYCFISFSWFFYIEGGIFELIYFSMLQIFWVYFEKLLINLLFFYRIQAKIDFLKWTYLLIPLKQKENQDQSG